MVPSRHDPAKDFKKSSGKSASITATMAASSGDVVGSNVTFSETVDVGEINVPTPRDFNQANPSAQSGP